MQNDTIIVYLPGAMTEVATLKQALTKAEDKAAKERTEREKHEARVGEVQQELQALVAKNEALELALETVKSAKAEAQKALQEIDMMKKMAAGKGFYMQSKHVKVNYLLLTPIRSSPGAFTDFPRSVSDAAQFYQDEVGSSTEKLFWSQYTRTE